MPLIEANPDAVAITYAHSLFHLLMNQGGQKPEEAASVSENPQTKEEIQALIDNLDMKLAKGELSEAVYNRLVEKWQKRLDEMG